MNKLTVFRRPIEWRSLKGTKIAGIVVARLKLPSGPAFGLDMNGRGDIFYVDAKDTEKLSVPKPEKKAG